MNHTGGLGDSGFVPNSFTSSAGLGSGQIGNNQQMNAGGVGVPNRTGNNMGDGISNSAFQMSLPPLGGGSLGGMKQGNALDMD